MGTGHDFGTWNRPRLKELRVPRSRGVVILDRLALHSPRTTHSVHRWPGTGCICPGRDQPWPGQGEGPTATQGSHLTGSCPPQTTYKGKSSFQTYSDYLRWERFLQQQLQAFPEGSALRRGFQTCEHWKQIFMEIIGEQLPGPPSPNPQSPRLPAGGGWQRTGR